MKEGNTKEVINKKITKSYTVREKKKAIYATRKIQNQLHHDFQTLTNKDRLPFLAEEGA